MFDDNDDDPLPGFDPRSQTQRVFQTQVIICTITGALIFFFFCFLRSRLPQIYEIRSFKIKNKIKPLSSSMFGWMKELYDITDQELLEKSGLDNFVFLSFFKLGIKTLLTISLLAILILSPIRYYYTGKYDRDGISWVSISEVFYSPRDGGDELNDTYLWMYTVFTYVFSILVVYFTYKETIKVIETRQDYLGSQNSITDRTIRVSHIPKTLLLEDSLKSHIEEITVGKVVKVNLVYDYSPLRRLFESRRQILEQLEYLNLKEYGLKVKIFTKTPSAVLKRLPSDIDLETLPYELRNQETNETTSLLPNLVPKDNSKLGSLFLKKTREHALETKIYKLIEIDDEIVELKSTDEFKPLGVAFVTMDSVASAQMCAQLVFSSNVMELITELAPSPVDINWENFNVSAKSKVVKQNIIQLLILIVSMLLIFPISYIAKLLNVKTIRKLWPEFGDYLIKNKWVSIVITGFLPTYLLTLINVCLPYLISYLTQFEGLISKGDIELSVIKKNFVYIFFNFFLVFTLFGTLSNYWALLTDTTKIAYLLASSIKNLSLFYVDLILLQGMIMFPFKLIQIDVLLLLVWNYVIKGNYQTPRSYRDLIYKPSIFDFGLILPQHMLIFIITLIYSVISTKIVASGLIYFVFGYFVYKYQLMFSTVHLRHSTGKCWPIIVRRICVGLLFMQLTMLGTLALEQSYFLALFIAPLLLLTMLIMFAFEKRFEPLLKFVALQSIFDAKGQVLDFESVPDMSIGDMSVDAINSVPGSSALSPRLRKRRSTIEEEREQFQDYVYPYLSDPMDGPWIGFEGEYITMIRYIRGASYTDEPDSHTATGDNIIKRVFRKKNTKAEYD